MKKEARILEYRGKELRTASDLANVLSALMSDIALGNVKPKEAREIQKEINERLKAIEQGVRVAEVVKKLKTLEEKVGRERKRR
jgi:hypothetical protein